MGSKTIVAASESGVISATKNGDPGKKSWLSSTHVEIGHDLSHGFSEKLSVG